jgi:hypothetical protein
MDTELAYLAGFFDGEGHVSVQRNAHGHALQVSVSQLDPAPLLVFQKRFGGSVHRQADRRGFRAMIVWTVVSRVALVALRELRPMLIVKASQVDAAIEFQSKKDDWTDKAAEIKRRDGIYQALRDLKQINYDHVDLPETVRVPRTTSPRRLEKPASRPSKPKPPKAHRVKVAQPIKSTGYDQRKRPTDDADIAILRGIYADHGLAATAREYGVSRQTIVNWLGRYGIEKQGRTVASEKRRAAAVAASWSTYRSSLVRS